MDKHPRPGPGMGIPNGGAAPDLRQLAAMSHAAQSGIQMLRLQLASGTNQDLAVAYYNGLMQRARDKRDAEGGEEPLTIEVSASDFRFMAKVSLLAADALLVESGIVTPKEKVKKD